MHEDVISSRCQPSCHAKTDTAVSLDVIVGRCRCKKAACVDVFVKELDVICRTPSRVALELVAYAESILLCIEGARDIERTRNTIDRSS